jgi:beta-lactamase class C
MLKKVLVGACIFLFCSVTTLSTKNFNPYFYHLHNVIKDYDRFVETKLAELEAPGAAIAIVSGDSIVYMKGFGVREIGRAEAIDPHTVFRIASLSKGFAAVLTGLLVQDSLLHWDDKVLKYLPDFSLKDAINTKKMTIRHILSHTTGLPSYTYDNLLDDNVPYDAIIGQLREVATSCRVGECYNYQNVVYSLIGKIIQSATGRDYAQLMKLRLFSPLGMKDASLDYTTLVANANHASPHIRRRKKWLPAAIKETYYSAAPAAGINASIADMAQWLRALLGWKPDILPPAVIAEVSKPVIKTRRELRRYHWNGRARRAYYAMGWRVFDYAGTKLVFHSGGLRGYVSQIAFLPEQNLGIAVLLNANIENIFVSTFLDMYFASGLDAFHRSAQR